MADEITNKVLLEHMHVMKKDLQQQMKSMEHGIRSDMAKMEGRIRGDFKSELKLTEDRLTKRIDALEEDLVATMQDTVRIRRHVGMPVASE